MELISFSAIGATLKSAQEALKVALESRDLIKNAPLFQQLNAAQQSVLSLTAQLFELQNKHLESAQELADLKKTLAQRNSYALFELSKGVFVYRLDVSRNETGPSDPGTTEPEHYICQPCMDTKGHRAVLVRASSGWGYYTLNCPLCERKYSTDEKVPEVRIPAPSYDPFRRL